MLHSKISSERLKIERESNSCMWLASLNHRVIHGVSIICQFFMLSWLQTVPEFLEVSFWQGIYYKPNSKSIN